MDNYIICTRGSMPYVIVKSCQALSDTERFPNPQAFAERLISKFRFPFNFELHIRNVKDKVFVLSFVWAEENKKYTMDAIFFCCAPDNECGIKFNPFYVASYDDVRPLEEFENGHLGEVDGDLIMLYVSNVENQVNEKADEPTKEVEKCEKDSYSTTCCKEEKNPSETKADRYSSGETEKCNVKIGVRIIFGL